MSYWVTHRDGRMEGPFPEPRFSELLDELISIDQEHVDVSVSHESEWALSIFRSGLVVLQNVAEGSPMHIVGSPGTQC